VITAIGAPDAGHGGALPITARQMNNMMINSDGSFASELLTDTALSGYTEIIDTSHDLPQQVAYGEFTQNSVTVGNVSNASALSAGDALIGYPGANNDAYLNWPVTSGNAVTRVTNGSITLSQPATLSGHFPIYPVPISQGASSHYSVTWNAASYVEPVYIPSGTVLNALDFGAVPDAQPNYNYTTYTMNITGTDSAPGIQATIDYALQHGISTVCLPSGYYKIDDTI
jgi:hypothetical protein